MLNHAQWLEISPYLDEVLALPQEQRGAWAESLRQRNPRTADLLQELLEKHAVLSQEKFLEDSQYQCRAAV